MDVADRLAGLITELASRRQRLAVAVDGPDAAGKTTLAGRIASRLGMPVIRAGADGFHLPRQARYRRGELSAEGYYRDSFDYQAITGQCLGPFRDGEPVIATARYDFRADTTRDAGTEVPASGVLIFDGVFLLRPELAGSWDLAIYLRVSPETTLRRALARDLGLFGSAEEVRRRYLGRYLPGQALYRAEAAPQDTAHIAIGNDDPDHPVVIRWQPPGFSAREDAGQHGQS
ncbi:MAG TPA: AAA family ATPase [Streptosporangiaceae bacterium]|nr:AAA family ATPase [Streptosporangiaceae bacterium]